MELETTSDNQVGILTISGQIDAYSAPEVEGALNPLIDEHHGKVVMDLTAVDYVSSAGLRVMLAGLKRTRDMAGPNGHEGDLRIAGLQAQVKEVFDIAGFTPLFKLYDDATAAVKSFA
ncbi:MAG: STAS domain-containing protein [Chloroflexi bacterium]|nr:STAS domain-containing protein [Chloroflexota bacterium]MBU1752109.1 STAS domain-containing protein [Chloroflexota bacterium]MBU1879165.1 STAS domain-containing protein [Chloroflexota bacterium]